MISMTQNIVPFSKEAENYILGSILIDETVANDVCGVLNENDFHLPENQKIYRVIKTLYLDRKGITIINIIEGLKSIGEYKDFTQSYLFELADSVPTVANVESYVTVIREKSIARDLFYKSQDISSKILKGEVPISDLLAETEKDVKVIANRQSVGNMESISLGMDKVFSMIEENRQKAGQLIGWDTGYDKLNEYTLGFQPGELIILAARPGVGKSAFALNVARKMASNTGANIAFFSLEMSTEQLIMRLLSTASNVPLSAIRKGELSDDDSTKLLGGRIMLDSLNIYLDVTASTNVDDLKVQCRKLRREGKLDFIVIDYLQLLSVHKTVKENGREKSQSLNMSEYDKITYITRNLKLLALELNIPILALSQLSRNPEKGNIKGKKEPQLSDLRGSGSIEQDADIVLFLYADNPQERGDRVVTLDVAKNRQGETGKIPLFFRAACTIFENYKG